MKKAIKPSATPVEYLMNGGTFVYECDNKPNESVVWCSVAIEFSHSENETDEIEFDVRFMNGSTPDFADLNRLFMDFVSENKFINVIITGLRVTDTATTIEEHRKIKKKLNQIRKEIQNDGE